ncbi:hypothetical protein [Azospirillum largimobile]
MRRHGCRTHGPVPLLLAPVVPVVGVVGFQLDADRHQPTAASVAGFLKEDERTPRKFRLE